MCRVTLLARRDRALPLPPAPRGCVAETSG
nr:MAG TPA_asm: hypothetical protein [Caudoviricetes sp.]